MTTVSKQLIQSYYGQAPRWGLVGLAGASSLVVLVGGYLIFRRLEGGIADIA